MTGHDGPSAANGLRGSDETVVRDALEHRDPLPGTTGFAGELDGRLVRDVLGRVPLFVEAEASNPAADGAWAFRPTDLEEPTLVPSGCALDATGCERVWELPDPPVDDDHERALERVAEGFETAIESVSSEAHTAVAFSGGIDSALVAAALDAPLYVVGFPGSHDVEAARTAASAMGRADALTVVELEPATLEAAVPEVARATGRTNAMDVQIALPLYLVGQRAAADGVDALAVGQGADELFGGYEKVVHLDHRVEARTVRGAVREQIRTLPEQLPRDVLALEAAGVEAVAPLLHDAVVDAALRLPEELLADDLERKRALRLVSRAYLPAEVVDREKKAVQYGSLVARELDRLARQAGYKRRIGDHVTKYVESLV
ncbi:asparagine synthase C-terminal domain-containing protein [Natronobiforma cellulositropha]|uniref:asparagine synthase C-terminal domain-containing protein n=1 Tax=Natronobiforma cellulositropha TaxID=1679076 RepID=UPI0021D60C11|nr:asparagine synthase-related protein [Natronobiforma cellulositropha]